MSIVSPLKASLEEEGRGRNNSPSARLLELERWSAPVLGTELQQGSCVGLQLETTDHETPQSPSLMSVADRLTES